MWSSGRVGEKTWVQRVAMMRPGSRGTEPGRRVGCPGQFKDRSHQQSVLRDSLKSCERSRPGLVLLARSGQLRLAYCVRRHTGVPAIAGTETWRIVHVVHSLLVRTSPVYRGLLVGTWDASTQEVARRCRLKLVMRV